MEMKKEKEGEKRRNQEQVKRGRRLRGWCNNNNNNGWKNALGKIREEKTNFVFRSEKKKNYFKSPSWRTGSGRIAQIMPLYTPGKVYFILTPWYSNLVLNLSLKTHYRWVEKPVENALIWERRTPEIRYILIQKIRSGKF